MIPDHVPMQLLGKATVIMLHEMTRAGRRCASTSHQGQKGCWAHHDADGS